MACSHFESFLASRHPTPSLATPVINDECSVCFANQDSEGGILVCTQCYNGSCPSHVQLHIRNTGHGTCLRLHRTLIPNEDCDSDADRPSKITKLAIGTPDGFPVTSAPKYEYDRAFVCTKCPGNPEYPITDDLSVYASAIAEHKSLSSQATIESWQEERITCEHVADIVPDLKQIEAKSLAHCASCDLTENLWLCLTCGSLGCGRSVYGGGGGNNHGVEHYQSTRHGVVCKLGTITPEGTADIYCYLCDEMRLDPNLAQHLARFGISISTQKKTDLSMAEMELEQNLNHEWSNVIERGQILEQVWGPKHTGLSNIGNSCYIASVLQCLMGLPAFSRRYVPGSHIASCTSSRPWECFHCQMDKLAHGLYSGIYSPEPSSTSSSVQIGIAPRMLKHLLTENHDQFRSSRQQDAYEFVQYLLQLIRQREHQSGPNSDPTTALEFASQTRLQCNSCHRVRYRTVSQTDISISFPDDIIAQSEAVLNEGDGKSPDELDWPSVSLQDCLKVWAAPTAVDFTCDGCNRKTSANTQTSFETFPEVLLVHVRRFVYSGWVPKKIGTLIDIPLDTVDLQWIRGNGLQPDEDPLPEVGAEATPVFTPDSDLLEQLTTMGFSVNACTKALKAAQNAGAEAAMNWLFEHNEDADFDAPLPVASGSISSLANPESVAMLASMGFSDDRCKFALSQTDGNVERAVDWLFSHPDEEIPREGIEQAAIPGNAIIPPKYKLAAMVTHLGQSTSFGHYVAHVRDPDTEQWIYFNDDKVTIAPQPPFQKAYLYFFQRQA